MAKSSTKKSPARKAAAKDAKAARGAKMIYSFGEKKCDGDGTMKSLLGGKGANLAQMTKIGLPVPPGFTITTAVCIDYYKHGKKFPKGLEDGMHAALKLIEKETGKTFGDPKNALLLSVRSGARDSMPGMMDTILNLGLNDETVKGLAEACGSPAGRLSADPDPAVRPFPGPRRPAGKVENRRRGARIGRLRPTRVRLP